MHQQLLRIFNLTTVMRLWEDATWMVQLMALEASHPLPAFVPHSPVVPNT